MRLGLLLILSFVFFISPASLNAQVLSFSKAQSFKSGKDVFYIGGWVNHRLMIFNSNKKKSYIDFYDTAMNKLAIVSLDFMPESPNQVELFPIADGAILMYSVQMNSKEAFYIAALDKDGRLIGRPKNIENAKQNYFGNTKRDYAFLHSIDNKAFGVLAYMIKDNKLDYEFIALDESLNFIVKTNDKIPAKNYWNVNQLLLKNDGSLVLLLSDLTSNKNNEVSEAMVYEISPTGTQTVSSKAFPIDFGSVFVENLMLKEDFVNNEKIHFAGLNKDKGGKVNGIFLGNFNLDKAENEKIKGVFAPFSDSIAHLVATANLNNVLVKEMIVKNDGGMLLVTESMAKYLRSSYGGSGFYGWGYYGGPSTNSYTEYLFKNALLFDVNAEGKLNWISIVNKTQRTIDDNGIYSSFGLMNAGSFLGFVFNEFEKKSSRVKTTIVANDGQQDENTLNLQAKADGKWMPRFGKQTGLYEMVVPIVGLGKLQFVKINY